MPRKASPVTQCLLSLGQIGSVFGSLAQARAFLACLGYRILWLQLFRNPSNLGRRSTPVFPPHGVVRAERPRHKHRLSCVEGRLQSAAQERGGEVEQRLAVDWEVFGERKLPAVHGVETHLREALSAACGTISTHTRSEKMDLLTTSPASARHKAKMMTRPPTCPATLSPNRPSVFMLSARATPSAYRQVKLPFCEQIHVEGKCVNSAVLGGKASRRIILSRGVKRGGRKKSEAL